MDIDRRTFLKHTGIGLATACVAPSFLACNPQAGAPSSATLQEIGIQLYTLRDQLAVNAQKTIVQVASIGYNHVETFDLAVDKAGQASFWGLPLASLQELLDHNGLQTHSGHYDLSDFLSATGGSDDLLSIYIETAAQLGQRYLIAPIPPMMAIDQLDSDAYRYMADQLNKGGELAAKSGVTIGYHNHFWEFRTFADGLRGMDILISQTEPDLVAFELDLFWTEKSGVDSAAYIQQYPGRFPLWHVKDMDKANAAPVTGPALDTLPVMDILAGITYTEVGTGAIDFGRILANAETAGLQYAFVEQDFIANDPFESITQSYRHVREHLMP